MVDIIPFTDDGLIEATSLSVTTETFDDAWQRVVGEAPYLSEADRAQALRANSMSKPPGAYSPGFHIAEKLRVIAVQGGWWYRGVTSVEPHPSGSLVTYTVVNVAQGWGRWVAHFFQARKHRKKIPRTRE